jgi:serine/threonine protein kinase
MRFYNFERFSQEFKNLYLSIVAFSPKKRPRINDILTDPWLKEINEKNPEEYQKLEQKYYEFMKEVENKVKENNQPKIEIPEKEGGEEKKRTRGFTSVKEEEYFVDLTPKK